MKFNIGLGIISLPNATTHVGWLTSLVGLAIMGIVGASGIIFAVEAKRRMDQKQDDRVPEDGAESEDTPLLPESGCGFFDQIIAKVLGEFMRTVFVSSILLGQFVTLVIYIIVIVANLESYFAKETMACHVIVLFGILVVMGGFMLMPTLKEVAVLSALGLLTYVFLLAGLLVHFIEKVHSHTLPDTVMVKPISASYGQWFGVSLFAYGALPLAVNVYEDMLEPAKFQTVICWVYSSCWVVYSMFAMLGYFCYGENVHALFYFNFTVGTTFRLGSSAALSCILAFSWLVQAMPIFYWAEGLLGLKGGSEKGMYIPLVRWTILVISITIAYAIPDVKVMMNTVGAATGVLQCYIIPALTYLILLCRNPLREDYASIFCCCIVIAIGVAGAWFSISSSFG